MEEKIAKQIINRLESVKPTEAIKLFIEAEKEQAKKLITKGIER
ncbi:hypothetical protein [Campylobacter fetus]|nr:hypothetical protein [Campylobacter fetus]